VSLWRDCRGVGSTLAGAGDAFADAGTSPRWATAFVLILCSGRVLEILTVPSGLSFLARLTSMESLARALVLFGGLAGLGLCSYLLCVMFDAPVLRFLPLFAVTVHSEAVHVTRDLVNLLLLVLQGRGGLNETADLFAVPGLDVLVQGTVTNLGLLHFLNSLNPFAIWYVATLAAGIGLATGIGKWKCLLIASCLQLLRASVPALLLGFASSPVRF
jgi:hypothetical protein